MIAPRVKLDQYVPPLTNAALLLVWFWLYRAVYPYLGVIFTAQEFRTNQIILVGVLALIVIQVRKGELRPRLDALPQLYSLALALALGSSVLYLLVERYLEINTFSASLFGLASYGLLGLWMQPRDWRRGLPTALLLVGALPFGDHLQTFVGYPLRVLTATIIQNGLNGIGVHSVSVDTILVFESGFSKIDLPCSGIKSLWTGGLFLLAATWIERRPINFRWLLVAMGTAVLLLAANLVRVTALVLVGQVAGWGDLAAMLHVPLGVLGFSGACAAALWMLRWVGGYSGKVDLPPGEEENGLARPVWLAPGLGAIVLVMALLYVPRSQVVHAQPELSWNFPPELSISTWTLTSQERKWLNSGGVEAAYRWRFEWDSLSGSLLFVTSTDWRAQHRPEHCFEVYGLSTDRAETFLVAPDFPIKLLSLKSDQSSGGFSAAYWLQSEQQTTDDYATRIWADLAPQKQRWVLVTVLFDQEIDPQANEAQALYRALRLTVHNSLKGGQ
ncbi:MAG: exosortase O [Anaerolineales bacterium]|jgi:exosortase O